MITIETAEQVRDLEYAIAKATENILKATGLGRSDLAQQIRRERKCYQATLDALTAKES